VHDAAGRVAVVVTKTVVATMTMRTAISVTMTVVA
jgi:hypothetical protein